MTDRFVDCPPFLAALADDSMRAAAPGVEIAVGSPDRAALRALLADCRIAAVDHTEIDAAMLADAPTLRAVVFLGTGASSYIDLAAARARGVVVRTIRGYGDRAVAEHAAALMFAAGRKVAAMDRAIRAGGWETLDGVEFAGRTLGVVGAGGIGREAIRIGAALGMKVVAWSRSGVPAGLPCAARPLDALLAESHVVSLHLALTPETAGILDRRRLGLMRPGAILVNTARGGLVDEAALIDALRAGRPAHAALDVFADEPPSADSPLRRLDNVTLTAHAGFMTREASVRLLRAGFALIAEERARMEPERKA